MPPPRERRRPGRPEPKPMGPTVSSSIAALDSKLKLIAQRLKIIENNEQVIGRTIVSLNKKMKELEASVVAGGGGKVDLAPLKESLKAELREELAAAAPAGAPPIVVEEYGVKPSPRQTKRAAEDLSTLKKSVDSLKSDVSELKYILESINPLEYVTIDQLGDVIDRKVAAALKKKKKD